MSETFGALTKGVARLCEHGELAADADGVPQSLSDIYEVWLGRGVRATSANVSDLPAVNAAHGSVSGLYVDGYRFACVGPGNGVWHVTVDYARSETSSISGGEVDVKLTARSWGVNESTCDVLFEPGTGAALLNAAGDPFDSVPQRTIIAPTVSFSRLESRAPASVIAYNGSINAAAVTVLGVTFAARSARIKITVRDTMAESGLRYECSYEISGRVNYATNGGAVVDIGWDEALIECGYNYLGADGKRYKFTVRTKSTSGEIEEKEASTPQLLTAAGGDGRGQAAVVKVVATNRALSWTDLKLPE